MATRLEEQYSTLPSRSNLHLTRKFWHVGMGLLGLFIVYLWSFTQVETAVVLMVIAVAGLIFDLLRIKNSKMNVFVIKYFGAFMRKSEVYSLSGLPYFAFGTSMSLFLFPEDLAILSIIFLIFADPISSLFGILYGKNKFLPNKSLEGSFAGFLTCFLITMFYGGYYNIGGNDIIIFSLFAGVIGSVSEMASIVVDDNLTIPLLSGAGLTFLNVILPLF